MKTSSSVRVQQDGDQIVKRKGVIYRINKKNPRRKKRQG